MSGDRVRRGLQHRLLDLVPRRTLHTWRNKLLASDAVLFGAGTLRAYGTTLTVSHPQLLQQRTHAGKPSQPVYILITHSGNLNPEIRFFQQQVLRWLLTTTAGALFWKERQEFELILACGAPTAKVDIHTALRHLTTLGIKRLAVLGGGTCVASMLELHLISNPVASE